MSGLLYDYMTDGIIGLSPDGKIYYVNRAGLRMLGRFIEDLKGAEFDSAVLMQNFEGRVVSLKDMHPGRTSLWMVRADRTLFPADVMRFDQPDGRVNIMIVDNSDESSMKGQKDDFIALISHQLRTPTNIIAWYGEMLANEKHGPINEKQARLISQIQGGSRRLSDLMGNIVNAARYDLNRIKIKKDTIDLEQMIRHICLQKSVDFQEKEIQLTIDIGEDVDSMVVSDKEYLGIVMKAVIDNSIRYNDHNGSVTISLKERPFNPVEGLSCEGVRISVQDTGIGIPSRQRFDVFKKLFRAENAQQTGESGLGLGLYLAKRYVNQLGGTIHFESAPGDGATFFIDLPKTTDLDIINKSKEL